MQNLPDKTALILVNVGTPDAPTTKASRKYLSEFLNDPLVIDIPYLIRKILVNLIIVPFRAPVSAKKYKQLWTSKGSPLLSNMNELTLKVQQIIDDQTDVFGLMRYGNPSLKKFLEGLQTKNYSSVIIFPLYPQYASSTTGSVKKLANKFHEKIGQQINLQFIEHYYNHPAFIDTLAGKVMNQQYRDYDHIVFSYHGLPTRQVEAMHPGHSPHNCTCKTSMPSHGKKCYLAHCYETTRLLASKLALTEDSYSTTFQSRLSRNWLRPFTDEALLNLASSGKKVLVVPASFTADCLETIVEIENEYSELFYSAGGEKLTMTRSLNSDEAWANAIVQIMSDYTHA